MAQTQQQEQSHATDRDTNAGSFPLLPGITTYYDNRAPTYDTEPNSFHLRFAREYISWASPHLPTISSKQIRMLDLCCGTGMVSEAAVSALGAENVLIDGVDISRVSLKIAEKKLSALDGNVHLWEGSVLELGSLGLQKGSYDLITCCSALVLLPGPYEVILKGWSEFLAPGGVLIFDVPAPQTQAVGLMFGKTMKGFGLPVVGREDFEGGVPEVTRVIEAGEAALRVEKVFETILYGWKEYERDGWEESWERMGRVGIPDLGGLSQEEQEQAKQKFGELWLERAEKDGGVVKDETKLVVAIAIKEL